MWQGLAPRSVPTFLTLGNVSMFQHFDSGNRNEGSHVFVKCVDTTLTHNDFIRSITKIY